MKTIHVFLWLLLLGMALVLVGVVYVAVVDRPAIGFAFLRASIVYAGLLAFGLFTTLLWKSTCAIDSWRAKTTPQDFNRRVGRFAHNLRAYARMILRRSE